MRLPVRIRCQPLGTGGRLRPIRPQARLVDLVVFCVSNAMEEDAEPFLRLLGDLKCDFKGRDTLLLLPLYIDHTASGPDFGARQGIRWCDWTKLDEGRRRTRALLRIVTDTLTHLWEGEGARPAHIFISHAKRDGRDMAEEMVRHLRDPEFRIGLEGFYDVLDLRDGHEFPGQIDSGVRNGALLALVTDAYEGRPWCNREVLTAKRARRPALVVDVGRTSVSRTYPYIGNLPFRRNALATAAERDRVVLDLAAEMLRCELFSVEARRIDPDALALPRPPELLDRAAVAGAGATRVLYPDPPLSDEELDLVRGAMPGVSFETLEEALP
jgi:hypothetical protein